MKIIVTGNIGCGKSTVVRMMQQAPALADYQLFDFDQMVAKLYEDDVIKMQLDVAFGTSSKCEISDIVHRSQIKMDTLQSILNGWILANTRIAFKQPNMIYDIPLWYEKIEPAIVPISDFIIVCVCATEDNQIERVKARNGWSEEKIRSVIDKQWKQAHKAGLADYVITNYGTVDQLKAKVDEFTSNLNKLKS